jgi:hypothetical protein
MCNITCARLMLSCMGSRNFIRARMSKVFKNIVVLVVLDDARGEDRVVVSSGLFGEPSESFYLFKCFNWSTCRQICSLRWYAADCRARSVDVIRSIG